MDQQEKAAHLERWANPHTCLARVPVRVTDVGDTGEREAVFSPPLDQDARDDLDQLIQADPCFILRLDGSAVEVRAEAHGDLGRLRPAAVLER
ncbi:hypothetical protein [Streptomyces thermolilacinus]|uniref:Uncharacterized protein n=1 Tax=Streptomyces thermolilacinus SPC6 TaxID=1306406 RepID=A0A1D3DYM0_9ACTN|nr:hypothetical protein [Streptomyces thermolilacinus]OEJ97417.1 hypothetical protein J116_026140 [Streptomyces thermolilacinus SPC6]